MDIKIGRVLKLKPLKGACQRTKNRIREHGSQGFVITRFDPGSRLFGNTPAVLFNSVSVTASDGQGGREQWSGWLPILEVEELQEEG